MMFYSKEFIEAMKEAGELAKNFSVSEAELENILIIFSQPTPEEVGEMVRKTLEKLNSTSK